MTSPLWQSLTVGERTDITWLTIPDVVEKLGVGVSKVRRLIEDRHLLARRIDGVWHVPDVFLREGQPLPELRGTLILLADAGFSDDEALDWLIEEEELLGTSPIAALRAGRKAEVRRTAQALA